jgi:RNA polymerase sigma-70 factor (ECF subfamily)
MAAEADNHVEFAFRPMTTDSEPESTFSLLERARAGDRHAIELLVERHRRPLQRWASGRLPRWARGMVETQDLVQETLFQTFRKIEAFRPERVGALQAYLRQAVLNRIRDELRRAGRRPAADTLDEEHVDPGPSPLEEAIGREATERYEAALAALRPEEREAIIGRIELGYTYDELAEALGKPSGDAARKAAERALVRLVEEMTRGAP